MRTGCCRGFTLVEFAIVVVILLILAGVAVPLWLNYTREQHREEARSAIRVVTVAEESYRRANGTYVDEVLGAPATAGAGLNCEVGNTLAEWDIRVVDAGPTGYTVIATGREAVDGRPGPARGLVVRYSYDRLGGESWENGAATP